MDLIHYSTSAAKCFWCAAAAAATAIARVLLLLPAATARVLLLLLLLPQPLPVCCCCLLPLRRGLLLPLRCVLPHSQVAVKHTERRVNSVAEVAMSYNATFRQIRVRVLRM